MDLIIVESPTKARTLSRFLGKDFWLEATMGHIKDLPKSRLGIDVDNNFAPQYLSLEKKKEIIAKLEKEAGKAGKIYIATDPDREGEAIAKHVEEVLRSNSKFKVQSSKLLRIVFHEITKEAVEEAIANPRDIDENLVDAQIARRVLDRLVGYELSPLLWKKVRRGLSAGRVQSVAVRLIVEREREILAFKTEEYWEIYATVSQLTSKSVNQFVVQLIKVEVKDEKRAGEIVADLKEAKYKVSDVKKREVRKNPYPPFTTSTMTQAGARLFGWSAKKTMSVAQSLYEEGLITYHRTDSVNIAKEALTKVRSFIQKEYGEKYLPETPKFYKTVSKVAQEAHEAIRTTGVSSKFKVQNSKFSADSQKLYDLIWQRFVACQMTPAVYDETVIDVLATVNSQQSTVNSYTFRASGQIMKFDGWRRVIPKAKSTLNEQQLPEVSVNEKLQLIKVDPIQKFTEPPARFNEASVIKTLEKLGIGRPSTYAPIITTIQIRNYVEKKEGKFFATPIGMAVTDFLMKNFDDVIDYKFTAEMEDHLDDIANGLQKWTAELKTFWKPFIEKVEDVTKNAKRVKIETEKLGQACPECKQGELVIRLGRFGKFISCSRFPDCKYTGKYIEKVGIKCPECKTGEVIIKKSKRGRNFFGCSRYPNCKFASWRKPVAIAS